MTSLVQMLGDRVIGTVQEVSPDRILVLLELDAPQATALNTGVPVGFPRLNGYVLVPNESGATVGIVSAVQIERLPHPVRMREKAGGLIDLPLPFRVMTVTPLGTLRHAESDTSFVVRRGVDVFPSVGDPVLLPTPDQLRAIVEGESGRTTGRILLGRCPTAGNAPVYVDPDKLFGRHLAVLGNTGAGKSCTVAGLIRWSIAAAAAARERSKRAGPPNARFIVLDPNGEYATAFSDLNIRLFQVEPRDPGRPLKVPAWLWNGEEWAAFSGASPGVQRPILFEALRRLRSTGGSPDPLETKIGGRTRRYRFALKTKLDAGDHLQFGRREGLADDLLGIVRDFAPLIVDAADRDVRPLLTAVVELARKTEDAARGKAKDTGGFWHNNFTETGLESVIGALEAVGTKVGIVADEPGPGEDDPVPFAVDQLPGFVQALAADTSGRDLAQFVDSLNLRIRALLARGRLASILQPEDPGSISLHDLLSDIIGADSASTGPITIVDFSLVPSEVVHILVAVLARIVFEAVQRHRRETGQELPTVLVLEEAHTFVHSELAAESSTPAGRACCRVFERIAREGRKFGLGLVLASQRPSELSPTALSQCNTFLLHRIVNDHDQKLVRSLVPDGLGALLRDLPSLPSRRAIVLGWAAPAPLLVEVQELPKAQQPHSPDPPFWSVWTGEEERRIDWSKVEQAWVGSAPRPGALDVVPPPGLAPSGD